MEIIKIRVQAADEKRYRKLELLKETRNRILAEEDHALNSKSLMLGGDTARTSRVVRRLPTGSAVGVGDYTDESPQPQPQQRQSMSLDRNGLSPLIVNKSRARMMNQTQADFYHNESANVIYDFDVNGAGVPLSQTNRKTAGSTSRHNALMVGGGDDSYSPRANQSTML
jgi:hypothetical protein